MIFLQKVTVFHSQFFTDDGWFMLMITESWLWKPIQSPQGSSRAFSVHLSSATWEVSDRHVEKGVHQATRSTGKNEGWNMFGSYNFIFWLVAWMFDVIRHFFPHLFPHAFNETSENILRFAKFFLVIFIEGEPLRNHSTGWDKPLRKCHQHLHKQQRRGKSSLHCSGIYRLSKNMFF